MMIYFTTLKLGFFFLGLLTMSFGFVFSFESQLGVAPWDVLHIGLHHVTSLSIGFWIIALGILIVSITFFLNRMLISWGTICNMVLCGYFADFILNHHLVPPVHSLWLRVIYIIIGILITGIGTGLYLAPKYGAGPRDGFTLELARRFGFSVRKMRTIIEITVVLIGWLLGGPLLVGTIIFSITIGPCMQYFLKLFSKLLNIASNRAVDHSVKTEGVS
jgi:uncharacterized membrane protein YczE